MLPSAIHRGHGPHGSRDLLVEMGLGRLRELVVRQPKFFLALNTLVKERPLAEWKTYLRWHVLRSSAPYLHAAAENEWFRFYGSVLRGQPAQEPRWQRAARVIDGHIGEALGQLYVERHFPPAAKARMEELIGNLKAVFKDRLAKLEWMSEPTRAKALAKFDRFTQKIGHPKKFRDYSKVAIRRDDYLGNVRRAAVFESKRQLARVGKPVDRTEWQMTPQTVNAYFEPLQNEIVFPAGILQPPGSWRGIGCTSVESSATRNRDRQVLTLDLARNLDLACKSKKRPTNHCSTTVGIG